MIITFEFVSFFGSFSFYYFETSYYTKKVYFSVNHFFRRAAEKTKQRKHRVEEILKAKKGLSHRDAFRPCSRALTRKTRKISHGRCKRICLKKCILCQHSANCGRFIAWNNTSILKMEPNCRKRRIAESFLINKRAKTVIL